MTFLSATGPWMYPLIAVGACLLGAILRAAWLIRNWDGSAMASGPPHNSVIVWGVLGLVVGLLGTVIGFGKVAMGARAVTGAERTELEAMFGIIWDGAIIIVTPVTVGLWLLTCALVAWLGLQVMISRKTR